MRKLKYPVLVANTLFILWVLYNAIDDGFSDITRAAGLIPLALAILLMINLVFVWKSK
jgi:hypothetical protein